MLSAERLLRLFIEIIFMLLGTLVIWLGLSGRITVDRHRPAWLVLSVILVVWGVRVLYKPGQWWRRLENWTRGLSFALLGVVMLGISQVPFVWVGPLLAIGGGLMAVRGLIGSALIFRTH